MMNDELQAKAALFQFIILHSAFILFEIVTSQEVGGGCGRRPLPVCRDRPGWK